MSMTDKRNTPWALAAAALLAGFALLPLPAGAQMLHNLQCYGNTSNYFFISELFSSENGTAKRRFSRAISAKGYNVPDHIECASDYRTDHHLGFRRRITDTFKGTVIIVDVASLDAAAASSARPAGPAAKTEAGPSRPPRNPAQEQALRTAQNQMDKSVSVALANALRTVPNAADCRMVESPPKVTTGYGPTREDALSQAMARTNSCKVVTTHCLENTKTEFTKEGRPKVAGKFWDCRLSYSCGETQKVCTNKPAAASKQ